MTHLVPSFRYTLRPLERCAIGSYCSPAAASSIISTENKHPPICFCWHTFRCLFAGVRVARGQSLFFRCRHLLPYHFFFSGTVEMFQGPLNSLPLSRELPNGRNFLSSPILVECGNYIGGLVVVHLCSAVCSVVPCSKISNNSTLFFFSLRVELIRITRELVFTIEFSKSHKHEIYS